MNSSRPQTITRLLVVTAVLLTILLIHHHRQANDPIAIALAKSSQMLAMGSDPHLTLDLAELPPHLSTAQFVQAVRLAKSEAARWNCPAYACALATFYDLNRSVTLNRVIDLSSQTVL
ncbi:MAG TPA: hypothetical protein PLK31_25280, partial [Chloroflexota bacterium]|nr:hypothetical protein [Chloroflexota bacterium]